MRRSLARGGRWGAWAAGLLLAWAAQGATPPAPDLPPVPPPEGVQLWFPVGETVDYQLSWGILPVGQSRLTSAWVRENGKTLLALRFTARNNKFIATLYPVNDFIECIVDPATFLPLRLTKRTREGFVVCDDELVFDRERLMARWTDRIGGKTVEYPIEKETRDVASLTYLLRSRRFEPGDRLDVKIAADDKIQEFQIDAVKVEPIDLGRMGRVSSILLKVSGARSGFFVRKIPGNTWVERDGNRLVTQLYVKVPIGQIRARLAQVDQPAHP